MKQSFELAGLEAAEAITEALADAPGGSEPLGRAVCELGNLFDAAFVALVVHNPESGTGYLVAQSIKPGLAPRPLSPELLAECRDELGEPAFGEPVGDGDTLLSALADVTELPEVENLTRVPFKAGRFHSGVLVMAGTVDPEDKRETFVRLARCFSRMFAMALRGSPIVERLKEQTRRLRPSTPSPSLSTRVLDRYREFFESSSDGVFIVDGDGKVCYLNHVAEVLTGYSSDWLMGRRILEVVAQSHREGFVQILEETLDGESLKSFDVDLETTSDDLICVNMAAALLAGSQSLVAFTFRDMTETRVVEQELIKTKEFLERIIQSTVDAIVCADTEGLLTLFNVGGERLFGYKSDNVVGRVHLSDLFPGEEGSNVLRQLHGPQRGGRGRLEPVRVEVLARDGERVPVQLTASLIYDGEEEVGIVAILSDLRERVRMEKRYHEMQERYLRTQKQALVAELAGTTAHELNQPLTSIMGYAEILEKRLDDDGASRRAIDVIMSEAERMADIVKKIGKITRYETKAYVGSTQILDLDKSTE
jgi:PAS domain S-box-containing protein